MHEKKQREPCLRGSLHLFLSEVRTLSSPTLGFLLFLQLLPRSTKETDSFTPKFRFQLLLRSMKETRSLTPKFPFNYFLVQRRRRPLLKGPFLAKKGPLGIRKELRGGNRSLQAQGTGLMRLHRQPQEVPVAIFASKDWHPAARGRCGGQRGLCGGNALSDEG